MHYLDYNSYKVWEYNDKFFMFDMLNMINVELDAEIYKEIKGRNLSYKTQQYLNILYENGLFFYDIEAVQFSTNIGEKEMEFTLTPILECNLNCRYCFAEAGKNYLGSKRKYDINTLEKIATYLVDKYYYINKFRLNMVSGGEPFLDKNGLLQMITFLNAFFSERSKKFTVWLCTNGTLVNTTDLKALDIYNVQIGISEDGNKEEHDKCRVDKNGNGTYEIVKQCIGSIVNDDKLSARIKKIWGSAVITSGNKSILSVLKEHKKLGMANSQLRLIQASKEIDLSIKERDLPIVYKWIDELIEFIHREWIAGGYELSLMILNENDYFGKIIRRLIIQKPYVKRCHAGDLHLAFTPEGDIYPCDSFVGDEKFKIGNICSEENMVFQNYCVWDRPACAGCWIRFVCGGDCYYNAYSCNGDTRVADKVYCDIMRYTVKKALYMLNDIQAVRKDIYEEIKRILELKDVVNYSMK